MLLVLEQGIGEDQVAHLRGLLYGEGYIVREMSGTGQSVLAAIGAGDDDAAFFKGLPGVAEALPIRSAFKLVSREVHPEDSLVRVGPVTVGGENLTLVAGPCAVESLEQALTIAREIKRYGALMFRGGAFKPRTSPYSFQGLQEEGLRILARVREDTGMPVVTEITSPTQADLMMKYVDAVQVGTRNMQNFELLKCVGRMGKPVILKRGLAATIEEWLMSAEYILAEGNDRVILCERGIRTFEPYTRNTLDLSAVPVLKKLTHLPVLIDPSHATGIREKVAPMARAGISAGADGLIVEVHHDPDKALSDGAQSLYPKQFGQLMRDIYVIAPVVGRQVDFAYLEKSATTAHTRLPSGQATVQAAYLGTPGSFSHKACTQYFDESVAAVPAVSFRAIFEAVAGGHAAYGIVPLENSLMGSIHENYDLLLEFDLKIVGEITLRIVHNLIGPTGTSLEAVRRVLAPPQAMRQCRKFLDCQPDWERVSVSDTAEAVQQVAKGRRPGSVAIASREAARIHGMAVLEAGIETNPRNFTRFVIIATRTPSRKERRKSSLIFSTGHRPGSLYAVLKIFADRDINMVKLESRPIHGKPWQYMFYVDIEIDIERPEHAVVLAALREQTEYFRILGCY